MTRPSRSKFVLTALLAIAVPHVMPTLSEARVVRFVVEQRRPVLDGKSFGEAGPYERLDGTVYFEVDPKDPLNALIINLDKTPQTPHCRGGVYAQLYIHKHLYT